VGGLLLLCSYISRVSFTQLVDVLIVLVLTVLLLLVLICLVLILVALGP
jgi:hypothetical protein